MSSIIDYPPLTTALPRITPVDPPIVNINKKIRLTDPVLRLVS